MHASHELPYVVCTCKIPYAIDRKYHYTGNLRAKKKTQNMIISARAKK